VASGDCKPGADVGILAYGRADFLAHAIESALAQTLTEWRLTICDNGPVEAPVEHAVQPYLA